VIVVGVLLGVGGRLTTGQLVGFLFLVTLFVQPGQIATEVLNEAQNAIAGLRRVLGRAGHPERRRRPGRRRRAAARAGRRALRRRHLRLPGGPTSCTTSTSRSLPAPGSPSSARPAAARPPSPSCSRA
jgi:hypothetical protein